MKNKKLKATLALTGYLLLVIALCISASIVFHNTYYDLVFVSGASMQPNLNMSGGENPGDLVDFGIVDRHESAINHISRFSIVSTYYPDDYNEFNVLLSNPKQKIKRVIAMPNETFKIEKGQLYVKSTNDEFELIPYTFDILPKVSDEYTGKDIGETTLKDNEYWVLGDHRDKSRDCGSAELRKPITKNNIAGVLVAIEGQATLGAKEYICSVCKKSFAKKGSGLCPNCYNSLEPVYELMHKQYKWPKYY